MLLILCYKITVANKCFQNYRMDMRCASFIRNFIVEIKRKKECLNLNHALKPTLPFINLKKDGVTISLSEPFQVLIFHRLKLITSTIIHEQHKISICSVLRCSDLLHAIHGAVAYKLAGSVAHAAHCDISLLVCRSSMILPVRTMDVALG